MWKIKRIEEADYGCEERLPGEPLMVLVTIESDDGRTICMEQADNWLISQGLDEGDEWPDNPDEIQEDELSARCDRQAQWMDNYYDAVNEMEETE